MACGATALIANGGWARGMIHDFGPSDVRPGFPRSSREARSWRDVTPLSRPMAIDPEAEAVAALDRGDRRAAIRVLMASYGAAVYGRCRMICGDDALADEVQQTVFVEAWRDLGGFGRRSSLRTWLFGIARHRCLDALKKRRRETRRFADHDAALDAPDPAPTPDAVLAERSDARPIERCLDELAPAARTAVLLRYQEGLSFKDMASMLRERPNTLQVRVIRAMPALRRCLESHGVER